MGIPSYFVYLVKNYRSILKKYSKDIEINNFYLDCNSIIYDAVQTLQYTKDNYESKLITFVISKIKDYINTLKPTNVIYIAFDGVAPVAKLEQQRNRRYKGYYTKNLLNPDIDNWDTCNITPGTSFMKNLNKTLKNAFNEFKNNIIIISGSDDVGEGEHKIFQYIRNNVEIHKNKTTVIYGLDADLIVLTLAHLKYSDNLFLFRETPYFINTVDNTLQPNQLYVMDIYYLAEVILNRISENYHEDDFYRIIDDYVLMTFLLGNDFMPHFPAINIRTNGIDILLDLYSEKFYKEKLFLTNESKVIWKNVRKFIQYLSAQEEDYIIFEMKKRDKMEKKLLNTKFNNKKDDQLLNKPLIDRTVEKYINPGDDGWQERYYRELFDVEINDTIKNKICINYLEGLEWNLKYYFNGCPDWRWTYKYNYPPLLIDLYNYVPFFDGDILNNTINEPVNELTQLSYVLPRNSFNLLPKDIFEKIILKYDKCFKLDYDIKWSFCRYFWESHVILPEIDIDELEKIILE